MKSTKKALLLSITSMLLCVAMLMGTTFAWFTDSVTSGTNRIVAGNLDVDMLYKSGNMTEYKTVNGVTNTADGSTPFFVDKNGGKILWEPGVMVYTYFDVKNLGTLALQYNFALRITEKNALMTGGVKHSLDEVIKAVVLPGEVAGNQVKSSVEGQEWKSIESFTDADSLQPNGNKKFTVVLYWAPTANDDLYNVKNGQVTTNVGSWENHNAKALYIDFDIRLTATQLDHENDSFDNTYDKVADLWKLSTVTPDGRWVGITKGESCILDGTLDPYITVVGADGQPGEIIALTDGLDKSVGNGKITVSGNNVTYTNSGAAQEVVIRTGSLETELTVNAPNDVVKHYDKAGAVNIIAAHTASYHEYGTVPFVEIAKGRIALEDGAEVTKLHFDATEQKDFDQIIVAAAPSVTLPEFSRDEATIKETGTLVVELQKDTNNDSDTKSDYVWLYKQGVISQIVVATENIVGIEKDTTTGDLKGAIKESTEYETLQLGVTTKAQETQKAAVEIANNYTGSHGTTQTVGGKENVNVAELDTNGDIKDDDKTAAVEKTGLTEEQKAEVKEEIVTQAIQTACEHQNVKFVVCNDETHKQLCTDCGLVYVEPTAHTFDGGVFQSGHTYTFTCTACGYHEDRTMSSVGKIQVHTADDADYVRIEDGKMYNKSGEEVQTILEGKMTFDFNTNTLKLLDDVNVNQIDFTCDADGNGAAILDLNGHVLTCNSWTALDIYGKEGYNLTINDSDRTVEHKGSIYYTEQEHYYTSIREWVYNGYKWVPDGVDDEGEKIVDYTIYGGIIRNIDGGKYGNAGDPYDGAGLSTCGKTTVTFNAGTFAGINADGDVGAIAMGRTQSSENCKLYMNQDAAIVGCSGGTAGVRMYGNGYFELNGGKISYCSGWETAHAVYTEESSSFVMKDGSIDHCSSIDTRPSVINLLGSGETLLLGGTITDCHGYAVIWNSDSDLVLDGVTIQNCEASKGAYGGFLIMEATFEGNPTLTIKGNTIIANNVTQDTPIADNVDSRVTIAGGDFSGITDTEHSLLTSIDESSFTGIQGGKFNSIHRTFVEAHLADGHIISDNGDGTFTVVEAE